MTPGRKNRWAAPPRFPRTARVNELLREIVASELERYGRDEDSLELVTVTGVEVDPDLRHATVYFSALDTVATLDEVRAALEDQRRRLQAAIGGSARLKRTPQLRFLPDPAIIEGHRVEIILRDLHDEQCSSDASSSSSSSDASAAHGG